MAGMTLAEANEIIEEPLRKGIIQTIARESTVLELLPFININGNSYSYIQEKETGNVGFREVNQRYNHDNPKYERQTEALTRLGSIVEVDRFIELTQNIHDVRAEATASKAKAIANTFTDTFFNGNKANDALAFDGLSVRVDKNKIVKGGMKDGKLDAQKVHELLDAVEGGADVLFMNKRTRREFTALFASQGAWIQSGQDAFQRPIQYFGDVRIAVVDDAYIPDNSIYAVKFGIENGVVGIQSGFLQAVDNGLRDVTYQTLIEWYPSIILGNPNGLAKLEMDVQETP